MKKKALITGIAGQDGSYLAELLLSKGYEVHGIIRRSSSFNLSRISSIIDNPNLKTYYGDITDTSSLNRILEKSEPDEIYNLAAQSHVKVSFDIPEYTAHVDALGTLRFLDAIKSTGFKSKFYQASTSELYGKVLESPQNEKTHFNPRSPYGVSKLFSYWSIVTYRDAYNLHATNGILFNHESPRRGETFVTRKISIAVAKIKLGLQDKLYIGNLNAKRDWGYAPEYVEGMWMMLQQDSPDDYVLATGETHSVREFIEAAFKEVEIDIIWKKDGIEECGIDKKTNKEIVSIDPNFYRPLEVDNLHGDSKKAKDVIGWQAKTKFKEIVSIMVQSDFKNFEKTI